MKSSINVMLIEDNLEYRDVISMALNKTSGIVLVNQYSNAEIAIRRLEEGNTELPDIILLDLSLPGMNGINAIPHLKQIVPETKIVMLTQSDKEADVLKAIAIGASGYLLKTAALTDIIGSIRSVQQGGATIDPGVARYLLENLKDRLPEINIEMDLSKRETEILSLLSKGFVKKEIADKLSIGYTTVDTHVRHIYEKLHVSNAPAAVSKAYKLGIFTARNTPEKEE
ncbi:response regulator transcription factor [Puniceicoccales bacterium CK1056]|uniref:Response regulator transcription factor n=1 Tax=Oceanipulchritudo coccoides TaxID=2706888 RepID=A0A6B2M1W0_9BACT|nr:response regulator transcription factor [Oceanipulchritudo coccoides]NDV62067.1 response regulator transcription factor [Oceanipulchritudo coccoides]